MNINSKTYAGSVITIDLPHVGESVTEGTIEKWLRAVGDRVEKYDPLVEVVTDKISMEVPSPASGVITRLLVDEGQTIPMGAPIAEMQVEDGLPEPEVRPRPVETAQPEAMDTTGVLLKDVAPVGPSGSSGLSSGASPTTQTAPARQRYSPAAGCSLSTSAS